MDRAAPTASKPRGTPQRARADLRNGYRPTRRQQRLVREREQAVADHQRAADRAEPPVGLISDPAHLGDRTGRVDAEADEARERRPPPPPYGNPGELLWS